MTIQKIRSMLPQLSATVYGKPLVYLDNAATSLRPQSVMDKWTEMSSVLNANLHRAVHYTAQAATEEYEATRARVAAFINAETPSNVVFTSGATAAINLLAHSFGEAFVDRDDEILIAAFEHHSDIVPWQMLCARKGSRIKVIPVLEDGLPDMDALRRMLSEGRPKIACISHISNVLGVINPINELVRICHDKGCAVLVDGSQGIVHCPVDVQASGCDFYVFSGHKIYAAPGTGVLYASGDWLQKLPPFMGGGEMISSVSWEKTAYADPPFKFEAGTQNISGIPTLTPALEFAAALRQKSIDEEYKSLCVKVYDALMQDSRIRLYGSGGSPGGRTGIFSFRVEGAHHEDLAQIMDKMGIALRSGQMCAEPLMDRYGVTGMVRASFAPYNTLGEAEYFLDSLDRAIKMLI